MPFSPATSLCSTLRSALHLIHRQSKTTHCSLQAHVASSLLCLFLPIYSLPVSQAPSILVVPRETTLDTSSYFNSLRQLMIKEKHKGQKVEITMGPSCLKKSHVNRCKTNLYQKVTNFHVWLACWGEAHTEETRRKSLTPWWKLWNTSVLFISLARTPELLSLMGLTIGLEKHLRNCETFLQGHCNYYYTK